MNDILQESMAFLADELIAHASSSATYKRGTQTAPISVVIGRAPSRVTTEAEAPQIDYDDMVFHVPVADLAAFGEPERGDKIIQTAGDKTWTYVVKAPIGDKPFSYSDARKLYRIHTQLESVI